MIKKWKEHQPNIDDSAWIAKETTIIGDVHIEKDASVFFHTVIRGDAGKIHIGEGSNVQDNCTLHTDIGYEVQIGRDVTIGHNCIIHGCIVEDEVLVGMGSIIMNGAYIEEHCIIAAGALVSEGKRIPKGSLVMGVPGKIVAKLRDEQYEQILRSAAHYKALKETYRKDGF